MVLKDEVEFLTQKKKPVACMLWSVWPEISQGSGLRSLFPFAKPESSFFLAYRLEWKESHWFQAGFFIESWRHPFSFFA